MRDGEQLAAQPITAIARVPAPGTEVFNLEVEGLHCYLAEDVLVHNKSPLVDAAHVDADLDAWAPDARHVEPIPDDTGYDRDRDGCITRRRADELCGQASNGAVCALAVSCGLSPDLETCADACVSSIATQCYRTDACLLTARDCTTLFNCSWRFD